MSRITNEFLINGILTKIHTSSDFILINECIYLKINLTFKNTNKFRFIQKVKSKRDIIILFQKFFLVCWNNFIFYF